MDQGTLKVILFFNSSQSVYGYTFALNKIES